MFWWALLHCWQQTLTHTILFSLPSFSAVATAVILCPFSRYPWVVAEAFFRPFESDHFKEKERENGPPFIVWCVHHPHTSVISSTCHWHTRAHTHISPKSDHFLSLSPLVSVTTTHTSIYFASLFPSCFLYHLSLWWWWSFSSSSWPSPPQPNLHLSTFSPSFLPFPGDEKICGGGENEDLFGHFFRCTQTGRLFLSSPSSRSSLRTWGERLFPVKLIILQTKEEREITSEFIIPSFSLSPFPFLLPQPHWQSRV